MTSRTIQGTVVTRKFVDVEVDPGIDSGTPKVNMIVEKSLTGVARAEVEGPAGKVSVREADQAKYKAWVANNTAIIFSANKTTDRLNQAINVKDANFTWRFTNGTLANDEGWGIWTTFNYTSNGGEWIVNLTVTQVNQNNITWRDITVIVDKLDPFANFKTNKTGDVDPTAHTINEDQDIRFLGADSSDLLYVAVAGEVAEWNWDMDSDGTVDKTGKTTNWTYAKPGTYTMTLFVKDFVGHRSGNRTMVFTVLDVTPPAPDFVVLDKETWREATQLTEGVMYFFNASRTTDNSLNSTDDNVNLTYLWKWGDNTTDNGTAGGTIGLLNVTHAYAKYGTDYKLNLTVWDAAGKYFSLTRTIVVAANATAHPDISIVAGSFKASTNAPEEGAQVTFTLNITNANGKETAQDLKVVLAIVERGSDKDQSGVTYVFLRDGAEVSPVTLEAGKNLTVRITWNAPTKVGNHSLKITVYDEDEPTPWRNNANSQTTSLLVKEAGWKFWALVGAFLFLIIGLPIILYAVRKFRAGEWELRRKRKETEEEEEEEEDEDEGKGKKRL
jgi:PKD repeat protein